RCRGSAPTGAPAVANPWSCRSAKWNSASCSCSRSSRRMPDSAPSCAAARTCGACPATSVRPSGAAPTSRRGRGPASPRSPWGGGGTEGGGAVVTVGTFGGVHRGHQAVLAEVARRARMQGLASLVVTFEPHPLEVVNPTAAPKLLTLPEEKRGLLAALGVNRVEVLPFTHDLAQFGPEEFVRHVLRVRFATRELVLGYDRGVRRGRRGDAE